MPNPDSSALSTSGATVELTEYIAGLLRSAQVLTYDPLGGDDVPEPIPDEDALYWAQLANLPGSFGGEVRQLAGRTAIGDGGDGPVVWDSTATDTTNNGSITGPSGTGRWKRPKAYGNRCYDARWFGVKGDGSTNDYAAFNDCLQKIAAEGGEIFLPPGVYVISGSSEPTVLSGAGSLTIRGAGPSTIIKKAAAGGSSLLNINGTYNGTTGTRRAKVRITGIRFEIPDASTNFTCCIEARGCEDVTIDNCEFAITATEDGLLWPVPAQTHQGVFISDSLSSRVVDNRFHGMQAKCESATGGRRHVIARNHFYRPYNFAISAVGTVDGVTVIGEISVTDNIICRPGSAGGIFIGGDGSTAHAAEVENIIVARNTLHGSWVGENANGILVNAGLVSQNIQVLDNIVTCDAYDHTTVGIWLRAHGTGSPDTERVRVSGNQVNGMSNEGIYAFVDGGPVTISDNQVGGCRGILVATGTMNLAGLVVSGNNVHDTIGAYGIKVFADQANISRALIANNLMVNCGDSFNHAGLLLAASSGKTLEAMVIGNRASDSKYGIWQDGAGTCDTTLLGNDCRNNTAAGFFPQTGAFKGRNNQGGGTQFVPEARGRTALGNGVSSATISHGLAGVLSTGNNIRVNVSLEGVSGDPALYAMVHSITSTQFQVALSGATGTANYVLVWDAYGATELV